MLRDRNAKESWVLLEDPALYDSESWNDPRDFAKPVTVISLPQDVPMVPTTLSTAWKIPSKLLLITRPCVPMKRAASGILSNSSKTILVTPTIRHGKVIQALGLVSNFMASQDSILSKFESDFKQQQSEMTNKIGSLYSEGLLTDRITGELPSKTKSDDSHNEELKVGENAGVKELEVEYFDVFPTRSELAYHKYLMCGLIPSISLRNPIIIEGCPLNLKIPCNIGYVHIEKAYIDLNSPMNIMTQMLYNWIMRRKLDPRKNTNEGVNNFTGRIKGMNVFVGNFTFVIDFMIVEDISSIIDPRLSQVVLGKPFVEISNMTHDPPEGVVRFTNGTDEIAYKMPHKIEQYNSLSDLEREHTKSVYLRNKEDNAVRDEQNIRVLQRMFRAWTRICDWNCR
ncbi:retrotransposon ORF1 [Tanacetum coccineum]